MSLNIIYKNYIELSIFSQIYIIFASVLALGLSAMYTNSIHTRELNVIDPIIASTHLTADNQSITPPPIYILL